MLKLVYINKQHDQITELLPWYVNNTLSKDETALVEQHLNQCKICQQDHDELIEMLKVSNHNDSVQPSTMQFQNIMQRVDDSEAGNVVPLTKVETKNHPKPLWMKLSMAASITALFIATLIIVNMQRADLTGQTQEQYQVLTTHQNDSNHLPKVAITLHTGSQANDLQPLLNSINTSFELEQASSQRLLVSLPETYTVTDISRFLQTLKLQPEISSVELLTD
ncbi:MAG: zf-HC2 domain-containing protein [Arenicella sp.]